MFAVAAGKICVCLLMHLSHQYLCVCVHVRGFVADAGGWLLQRRLHRAHDANDATFTAPTYYLPICFCISFINSSPPNRLLVFRISPPRGMYARCTSKIMNSYLPLLSLIVGHILNLCVISSMLEHITMNASIFGLEIAAFEPTSSDDNFRACDVDCAKIMNAPKTTTHPTVDVDKFGGIYGDRERMNILIASTIIMHK